MSKSLSINNKAQSTSDTNTFLSNVTKMRGSKNGFFTRQINARYEIVLGGLYYSALDFKQQFKELNSLAFEAAKQKIFSKNPSAGKKADKNAIKLISFHEVKNKFYEVVAFLVNMTSTTLLGIVKPESAITKFKTLLKVQDPVSPTWLSRNWKKGLIVFVVVAGSIAAIYLSRRYLLEGPCKQRFDGEQRYTFRFNNLEKSNRPYPQMNTHDDPLNGDISIESAREMLVVSPNASAKKIAKKAQKLKDKFNPEKAPEWLKGTYSNVRRRVQEAQDCLTNPWLCQAKSILSNLNPLSANSNHCFSDDFQGFQKSSRVKLSDQPADVIGDTLGKARNFVKFNYPISTPTEINVEKNALPIFGIPQNATLSEINDHLPRASSLQKELQPEACPGWIRARCERATKVFNEARTVLGRTLESTKDVQKVDKLTEKLKEEVAEKLNVESSKETQGATQKFWNWVSSIAKSDLDPDARALVTLPMTPSV